MGMGTMGTDNGTMGGNDGNGNGNGRQREMVMAVTVARAMATKGVQRGARAAAGVQCCARMAKDIRYPTMVTIGQLRLLWSQKKRR